MIGCFLCLAAVSISAGCLYQVETKPHGHGDVHALLHSTGLAAKWLSEGKRWVCFFQARDPGRRALPKPDLLPSSRQAESPPLPCAASCC